MSGFEGLVFDGVDLNDEVTWTLEGLTIAPPSKRLQRLSAADADADILAQVARHDLRTVTARVRYEAADGMDPALEAIADVVSRLQRAEELEEGSPLTWTPATGTHEGTIYVQSGEITEMPIELDGDNAGWLLENPRPVITIRFDCFPFIHLPEVLAASASGSGRILTLDVADVAGDVPALGRLVITDTATQNRRHIEIAGDRYGFNPSSPSDLDLTYADLTALAGTGVSSTYITYDVPSYPIAIAEAGSLPHVGPHKVRAQVERTSATGELYVRASVRTVDGPWTPTPWKRVPQIAGKFDLMLGQLDFKPVAKGTQSSTLRFEAYSDSTVTCRLYRLMPLPTEVIYAVCRSRVSNAPPTSFPIFDQFNQSSGNLAGKSASAGGTWAGAGDADDFTIDTSGHTARRTAVSDSSYDNGRFETVGSTSYSDLVAQIDTKWSANILGVRGLLARYVNTSNFMVVALVNDPGGAYMMVERMVGGVPSYDYLLSSYLGVTDHWYKLKCAITAKGDWAAWVASVGSDFPTLPNLSGESSDLASGGALASGKVGIYDAQTSSSACTRSYDNLIGYAPTEDVPLYSGRAAELAHDHGVRENSGGTGWADLPSYRGRRLFIPPAGPDDLHTRLAIKDRRNDIDGGDVDSADSSRSASLYVTPRTLVVP